MTLHCMENYEIKFFSSIFLKLKKIKHVVKLAFWPMKPTHKQKQGVSKLWVIIMINFCKCL